IVITIRFLIKTIIYLFIYRVKGGESPVRGGFSLLRCPQSKPTVLVTSRWIHDLSERIPPFLSIGRRMFDMVELMRLLLAHIPVEREYRRFSRSPSPYLTWRSPASGCHSFDVSLLLA